MFVTVLDNDGNAITTANPIPVGSSANGGVAVTPSDTVDLTGGATKGIYVGASGNLVAIMADGTTVTFTGLYGGVIHPISATRIKATGTTATSILAVY